MKVIFVASGNKKGGDVTSFVWSQYESLKAEGLDMRLVPVKGHGIGAYLKTIIKLRQIIRKEHPDVIHAHYAMCGYAIAIACIGMWHKPKKVVSILGSFPTRNRKWKIVRYMMQHYWNATIVKSQRTADQLGLPVYVIPNGVNLEVFRLMDHEEARKAVGFDERVDSVKCKVESVKKKYVIWCSNPSRECKNFPLAQEVMESVKCKVEGVKLITVYNKTPQEVCTYMNAADCLLLTSNSEGSPNVIKEAMACNCPIVTTDVGDVTERLHDLDGCYVVPDNELESERVRDLGNAIARAIEFGKRTEGRKRIVEDGLEITQIAKQIMGVYELKCKV